ncbi:unnamed protein product [Thlaspi arvense]|uniref:Uncharacterized protein n=1 Tax=Thlaspi arvense TaxID=13288 RepID=A0AAU9R4N6_THLAR|nr:unnamed protein product [Thlaspi arvense]
MSSFGYLSSKDNIAVENLLSQAMDLYVLEQVAAINCSGFTDSVLPANLETRFRRLKSLPVSRQPDQVPSSKKLLTHSKSMAGYPEKNHGNAFSGDERRNVTVRIKRDPTVKSRPLASSVVETRGIKRDPSVNSRGRLVPETSRGFSGSGRIGSVSSRFSGGSGKPGSVSARFSRDGGKVFSPPTIQTMTFLPREKSRISSSSFTSIDLASPSSDTDQDREEGSNRKSKSKSR